MTEPTYALRPIGRVSSPLTDRSAAPKQGDEGAPDAWIVLAEDVAAAAADLTAGSDVIVLTVLHLSRRDVLAVDPRSDPTRVSRGVFSTRSPDRPNPIGLHLGVRILAIDGARIQVRGLEAIDGTPVVDIKPVLEPLGDR